MAGLILASLLFADTATAEPKDTRSFRYRRFHPVEYVVTGITAPIAIAEYFVVKPQGAHWIGGILFDDQARDALRLRSAEDARRVWNMADGFGVTLVLVVGALDSVIVPLVRGDVDVAWQTSLMNGESFALGSLLTFTLYDTIGRARPGYVECKNGTLTYGCDGSTTASFPSGHVNEAFTAAGLSCAHHLYGHLYKNRVADAFACTRDIGLATTEAILRIMGDRHWASDVIVGSAIGFGFGFALPVMLHYVRWSRVQPMPGGIGFAF